MIGAVVSGIMDAGINISRENSMKQLRENMLLYDMQESFNEKLSMALADTRHKDANVVNRERDAQLNQNAEAEIRVPKIVFSTTITGDRLRLIIEAIVSFKNSAEKGDVYTRSYYSVHDLGKLGIDKSVKRKTAKLATKTEELAQLIDVSLDELTELFIDDYTDNKLKNLTAVERASPLISKTIFLRKMHIIKDNDNRVLMTSGAEIAPTMLYLDSSLVGKRRVIKK